MAPSPEFQVASATRDILETCPVKTRRTSVLLNGTYTTIRSTQALRNFSNFGAFIVLEVKVQRLPNRIECFLARVAEP